MAPFVHHTIPPQRAKWSVDRFLLANIVTNHCLRFCFSGNSCTFFLCFFLVDSTGTVCVSFPCYLYLYAVSPYERPLCALLLTSQHSNQIVLRIISGHGLSCLFKIPPLKMRMFLFMPIICCTLRLTGSCKENLNTTETSLCCLWLILLILNLLAHCTVFFKSYWMFVRNSRLHLMLLFCAGKTGELCCLMGGWVSTIFIH